MTASVLFYFILGDLGDLWNCKFGGWSEPTRAKIEFDQEGIITYRAEDG